MALGPRLEFRQAQSLTLTPQLMQSIRLLQLSHLELNDFVEAELLRNPLLERAETEAAVGATEPVEIPETTPGAFHPPWTAPPIFPVPRLSPTASTRRLRMFFPSSRGQKVMAPLAIATGPLIGARRRTLISSFRRGRCCPSIWNGKPI